MKNDRSSIKFIRECRVCGKNICIDVDEDGRYSGGVYFGVRRLGIREWARHNFEDGEFVRILPWYKILWQKLVDMKRLLLKQYEEIEDWECDGCCGK